MNRTIAGLVPGFLLLAVVSLPLATEAVLPQTDYIVKVTSATSGKEVAFEGALLLRANGAPWRVVTEKTPFEFHSNGQALSGLFNTNVAGARIRVDLAASEKGKVVRTSSATGTAVVVGDNVVQAASGFISAF